MRITLQVNGRQRSLDVDAHEMLLDVLRDRLQLTGAKRSCDTEVCGACTVLVDGKAVSSCTHLAIRIDGARVETIEGLAQGDKLHPLQESFLEQGGYQCGYCTAGMIMTAKALLDEVPRPTRAEVISYLRGNICRCTGYLPIIDAILQAASVMTPDSLGAQTE